jgi:hypothetical protein
VSIHSTLIQYSARNISQSSKAREIKGIQIGKEEVKSSLLGDDIILYLTDPNDCTKKLLDLVNTFSKVVIYKINIKISSLTIEDTNNNKCW